MKKYSVLILLIINVVLFFLFKSPKISFWWSSKVLPFINNYGHYFTKPYSFSVGDLLYSFLVLNLLFLLVMAIVNYKKVNKRRIWLFRFAKGWMIIILSFQLLWTSQIHNGFLTHYFHINKSNKVTNDEIKNLLVQSMQKLNKICIVRFDKMDKSYYLHRCIAMYQNGDTSLPQYNSPNVKNSMYSRLMNHMTVSGYYNPLSSESQVNKYIPDITYCFTTCHEIAHQIGFAAEDDANFVSYIKCTASDDINMRYSAELQLFRYALARVKRIDSVFADSVRCNMNYIVLKDIKDINAFWQRYEGKTEKITDMFYNKFLQIFGQKKGLANYSRMIDWVILYNRREQ